jgi:hypothetical protein
MNFRVNSRLLTWGCYSNLKRFDCLTNIWNACHRVVNSGPSAGHCCTTDGLTSRSMIWTRQTHSRKILLWAVQSSTVHPTHNQNSYHVSSQQTKLNYIVFYDTINQLNFIECGSKKPRSYWRKIKGKSFLKVNWERSVEVNRSSRRSNVDLRTRQTIRVCQ